jgi:hypothetical protein
MQPATTRSCCLVDGFYLARAAATFGDATGHYEVVLPDLARAFGVTRDWVGGGSFVISRSFNPDRRLQFS